MLHRKGADMSVRAAVVEMLDLAREEERAFVAGLTGEERDDPGSPSSWSAKALLAHITDFKQQQVVRVECLVRGEQAPDFASVDHLDPAVYVRCQARAWDEALAGAERVSADLVARAGELGEDVLTAPGANGRTLWAQLLVRGVWHSSGHLGPYLAQHGRADEAEALQQRLVDRARSLGLPPKPGSWAMGLYNLACAQVAGGRLDEARATLDESLELDPALARSVESDPDLEPLRAVA
jgi:tetratricopeptide (TPR) repeat protein